MAEIAVHREPAALAALVGALLLAAGLALSAPGFPPAPGTTPIPRPRSSWPARPSSCILLLVDRGAVLAWSFGVAPGRAPLAGVGVLLGCRPDRGSRRVPAAGGAGSWRAGPTATRPAGRAALGLAVLLAGAGLLLAVVRVASLPGEVDGTSRLALAGVAGAVAVLAGVAPRYPAGRPTARLPPRRRRPSAGGSRGGGAGDRPRRLRRAPRRHLRDPRRRVGRRDRASRPVRARDDGRSRPAPPRLPRSRSSPSRSASRGEGSPRGSPGRWKRGTESGNGNGQISLGRRRGTALGMACARARRPSVGLLSSRRRARGATGGRRCPTTFPSSPRSTSTGAPSTATSMKLSPGMTVIIGSGRLAQMRLDHPDIELAHVKVTWDDQGISMIDNGSRKGTWVNGEPVETVSLLDGDVIEFVGPGSKSTPPKVQDPHPEGLGARAAAPSSTDTRGAGRAPRARAGTGPGRRRQGPRPRAPPRQGPAPAGPARRRRSWRERSCSSPAAIGSRSGSSSPLPRSTLSRPRRRSPGRR